MNPMPKSSSDRRHFIIAGVLVAIVTVLLDWGLNAALPFPAQASTESFTIDQLFRWHVLLIAFLFALVMVFMFYTFVVFRRREGDDTEGEHFEGNTTLEIAWTAIPLVLVVLFAFIGVNTLNEITRVEDNELVIKATGRQWAWIFEYEGGVVSPELKLPVNQRVHMVMQSEDVLHSFWVPEFRVKQDLVPGRETTLRFTPTLEGDYSVKCAELCGLTHWNMLAPVKVVPESEFTAWLQTEVAKVNPAVTSAETGKTTE